MWVLVLQPSSLYRIVVYSNYLIAAKAKSIAAAVFLEKFVLLCGNSLNRIELVAPLFLLFLLIFAKTLGCNVIF